MELMHSIKVLGVGSSMREGSHGTRTLKIVLDMIKRYDAKTPSFIAAINATFAIISYLIRDNKVFLASIN